MNKNDQDKYESSLTGTALITIRPIYSTYKCCIPVISAYIPNHTIAPESFILLLIISLSITGNDAMAYLANSTQTTYIPYLPN